MLQRDQSQPQFVRQWDVSATPTDHHLQAGPIYTRFCGNLSGRSKRYLARSPVGRFGSIFNSRSIIGLPCIITGILRYLGSNCKNRSGPVHFAIAVDAIAGDLRKNG